MLESVRAVTVCTLFLFVPSRKALHFGALRNAGSKKGCLLEPCVTQEAKKAQKGATIGVAAPLHIPLWGRGTMSK